MVMGGLVGRMAFGYELKELISFGNFAGVYRAEHPDAHNVVAVKVFPKPLEGDKEFVQRFKNEEAMWGRLGVHRRIVEFKTGAFKTDIGPAIAIEYVDGPSLDAKLKAQQNSPLPVIDALKIETELLEALQYAHSKGVLHSDVHPGNVLLGRNGVKLTDFGLTRIIGEGKEAGGEHYYYAQYGQFSPGLTSYLPPELDMRRPRTEQSDLYQAGLVLACMLGRQPKDYRPIQKVNPRVSNDLAAIIERSLEYEPEKRYRSAAEFAEAISGYVNPTQFRDYPVRIRQLLGANTGVLDPRAIAEIGQKRSELEGIATERELQFDPAELDKAIAARKMGDTQRITAYVQQMKGRPRPIPQSEKSGIIAQLQQYKALSLIHI